VNELEMEPVMPNKRFGADQIVMQLRQIEMWEVSMAHGKSVPEACRYPGTVFRAGSRIFGTCA
jgi:hypothetical protein